MNAPALPVAPRRLPLLRAAPPRRPEVRGLCAGNAEHGCRWLTCRYHTTWLRYTPDEFAALPEDEAVSFVMSRTAANSCVLDAIDRADWDEMTEDDIAALCDVTQSAISQTITNACERIAAEYDSDLQAVQRTLFGVAKAMRAERRRGKPKAEMGTVAQLVLFPE